MTRPAQQHREFYQTLVDIIRSRTSWTLESDRTRVDEQVQRATDSELHAGELFFRDPDTDAVVTLRFPDYGRGASASFLLDLPLDLTLDGADGPFTGALADARQSIVDAHRTPYVEPIADPSLLLRATVPSEYDETTLWQTLEAMDAVAAETDELHASLFDVLETVADE